MSDGQSRPRPRSSRTAHGYHDRAVLQLGGDDRTCPGIDPRRGRRPVRMLVVDDGSTDGTPISCRRWRIATHASSCPAADRTSACRRAQPWSDGRARRVGRVPRRRRSDVPDGLAGPRRGRPTTRTCSRSSASASGATASGPGSRPSTTSPTSASRVASRSPAIPGSCITQQPRARSSTVPFSRVCSSRVASGATRRGRSVPCYAPTGGSRWSATRSSNGPDLTRIGSWRRSPRGAGVSERNGRDRPDGPQGIRRCVVRGRCPDQ